MSNSNVIKAAAVTYTQEIRTIDSNLREGGFTRLNVEKRAQIKEEEKQPADFEPGIPGLFVDRGTDTDMDTAKEEADQEALQRIAEQSEKILADARAEAERMLSDAEADADRIRRQAYEDGLLQGEKAEKEKYDALKKKLEAETKAARISYEKQAKELEPVFGNILIRLLEKLTGVLLNEKEGIILYLIEQALSGMEPKMSYLIHVCTEDFAVVNAQKGELQKKLKEGAELEVLADRTMGKGQCIIETDSRIFDCSIDTQLKNLTGDLRLLAGCGEE